MRTSTSFCFLFLLLSYFGSQAQNTGQPDQENTARTFNHEIGVNITPLLTTLMGSNLMERYEVLFKKAYRNGAIRLGFVYTKKDEKTTRHWNNALRELRQQTLISGIKVGYEYRWELSVLQFFTGADIMGGRSIRSSDRYIYYNLSPGPGSTYSGIRTRDEEWIVSALPFLGMKVHITPRFSLSARTGAEFRFGTGQSAYQEGEGQLFPELFIVEKESNSSINTFVLEVFPLVNYVGFNFHF